ncbi:MAG: DUF2089 domain-containing protein [Actinobacteria bacterium]|nr:DUF2089 domain-containing protein [Actinomycetota bacterium]MCG2794700.1 DUF2089 domain-containing protein [Actinomycetes bacterium]
MEIPAPVQCQICEGELTVKRVACHRCGCALEGNFALPLLARLTRDEQKFIEIFVSLSGNLKNVASTLGVSYPTVRNRLDNIIASLDALAEADRVKREELIDSVERGEITPSVAARLLEEA